MKIFIIGGVAGGMSAAARLRRLSEDADIVVLEKGLHISFANCGLPYYIGGIIGDKKALVLQTPEAFKSRFNIDVRVGHEVLAINRTAKEITVKDLTSEKTYGEKYDRLILSPGAEPLRPAIPGINHKNIFTLRTLPDTFAIEEFIRKSAPQAALVVGGGAVGLEMAENLNSAGIKITIVEALPQVMNPFDMDMASHIHKCLRDRNIELFLSDGVKSFSDNSGRVRTVLGSGREIATDMVILAIGVKPETRLASEAGLSVGRGITVNEFLQTSDPDIYAVGDAVEVLNPVTGLRAPAALAGPANKQGRMAADNILEGNKKKYPGTFGAAVLKIFDMTIAVVGASAKALEAGNIPHESVIVHPGSHAGYYPGSTIITLKLLFSPSEGKILGAQAVGSGGVDKRIDVISAYMAKGGTVYDLTAFEQCYAPPYSAAKDAVNMAGFAAENILTGKVKTISWEKLASADGDFVILDVRTEAEYREGAVKGALNIPLDDLRKRIGDVPRGRKIAAYCRVGFRSYMAVRILMHHGFDAYNLSGGHITYSHIHHK